MSSALKNESHDLRMANIIKNMYNGIYRTPETLRLHQLLGDVFYEGNFGTKEVDKDNGTYIYNVNIMRKKLEFMILHTKEFKYGLDNHFDTVLGNYTCLGTLNIYEKRSRKMEFIPECD
jgi:hypothetical protein